MKHSFLEEIVDSRVAELGLETLVWRLPDNRDQAGQRYLLISKVDARVLLVVPDTNFAFEIGADAIAKSNDYCPVWIELPVQKFLADELGRAGLYLNTAQSIIESGYPNKLLSLYKSQPGI